MEVIAKLISQNVELMNLLKLIKGLDLSDSWLCAGTLRNFIWNKLSNRNEILTTDIDLVFFDPNMTYQESLALEQSIIRKFPQYNWDVKNEVYMHYHTPGASAYRSACDAISKFPEKCTAIGARLNDKNQLELFLPYGEADILQFQVNPTPYYTEMVEHHKKYNQRQSRKAWSSTWPQLKVNFFPE
ncbi:nucleotidyltransferase family protein [Streptococcus porcinus]|uniref:Uncharacterized protein conserved in bacteria n=1 Tax=Streptococcus porcinus TaxID=1340 RepID=A0A4V6LXS1_STRPO|nr:nucleotidyltransferase family protein [Streptococcus porcinus]VTT41459.1 Uncharacterized protein conserved in bacteria [Streptococcus porcinus]VTT42215.1 Uncharacterized protein conserved in bacteria [Streptococcus porcinus]